MIKKLTGILLILVLLVTMIPTAMAVVDYIEIDQRLVVLKPGETFSLDYTISPEDETGTWSSSNPQAATVKNGTVTAVASGKTVITLQIDETAASCVVVVLLESGSGSVVWDGTYAEPERNENGDFLISTASQLAYWAELLRGSTTKTDPVRVKNLLLQNDIDLNDLPWATPGSGDGIHGTFDGQGHTISGLNAQTSGRGGLIQLVAESGTVQNLTVKGTVNGGDQTGGIVGKCYGHIYNCLADVTVNGSMYVGGICGGGSGTTWIEGCANLGDVKGSGHSVGGILGQGEGAIVKNCYNRGDIIGNGDAAGIAAGFDLLTVRNCYSTGAVKSTSASSNYAGPISTRSVMPVNCYYLNSATYTGINVNMGGTGKSAEALKEIAPSLGNAWARDIYEWNDGYPILSWQAPDPDTLIQLQPPAATVSVSGNTATVTAAASTEDDTAVLQYRISKDGSLWESWQTDADFYGLTPAQTYYFQARYVTGQPVKYLSSEPCDAMMAAADASELPVLDAPILNPALAIVSEHSIQLPMPEIPDEAAFWSDMSLIQYRMCTNGVWGPWQGNVTFADSTGYTFSDLVPGKSYSFQARYVARDYYLNSPASNAIVLTTSDGMMNVNFRLIGLTFPLDPIDLSGQTDAGFHGAKYRNWMSTQAYSVPNSITASTFVAYPLSQQGLRFELSNGWWTWVEIPELFKGEGYGSSTTLKCESGYLWGSNAGWVLLVLRDGKVIQEADPNSGTTALQSGDTVVLCFVGDKSYELKTVPGMTGFNSHGVNYGLTKYVHDFLATPDLTEAEMREMLALEKRVAALEVNLTDDSNIKALEEAYAALSDGQKEAFLNYDKLVAAREAYDAARYGDLNEDGTVDEQDVTVLTRYLAGWPEAVHETYADLNRDGAVDVLDLVILRRHTAKWTGYEALPYTPPAS